MEQFAEILNKSLTQYQNFFRKVVATVEQVQLNNYAEMLVGIEKLNTMFADILQTDKELYSLTDDNMINLHADLWKKRTQLIERTLAYHKETLPRLQSIMAVQKTDIQRVRSGMRGMNGYHSGLRQTGTLVKSSS